MELDANSCHTETQRAPQTTGFKKEFKEAVADTLSPECYVVQQLATVNTKENASYSADVLCSTGGLQAHFV